MQKMHEMEELNWWLVLIDGAEPRVTALLHPPSARALASWVDGPEGWGSLIKGKVGFPFAPRVPSEPPFQGRVLERTERTSVNPADKSTAATLPRVKLCDKPSDFHPQTALCGELISRTGSWAPTSTAPSSRRGRWAPSSAPLLHPMGLWEPQRGTEESPKYGHVNNVF